MEITKYIEERIKEQLIYCENNYQLNSEQNAYMNGVYKVIIETLIEHIKRTKK